MPGDSWWFGEDQGPGLGGGGCPQGRHRLKGSMTGFHSHDAGPLSSTFQIMLWVFYPYHARKSEQLVSHRELLKQAPGTGGSTLSSHNRHWPSSPLWLSLPFQRLLVCRPCPPRVRSQPVYLPSTVGPHPANLCHPPVLCLPHHFAFLPIYYQSFRKYVRIWSLQALYQTQSIQ